MPMSFDYQSQGGSLSFWIGQKFSRIALCFIFGLGNKITGFFTRAVQISINGQKASNRVEHLLSVIGDLAWLYHQEDVIDLNTYLLHEQNHVEVSCEVIDASKAAEVSVLYCGVREYKDDEEMKTQNLMMYSSSSPNYTISSEVNDSLDNTQFSMETNDNQCQCDDNLNNECFSLPKTLRIYEISDEQWEQNSVAVNPEMLKGDECMAQENVKTVDIMSADVLHQSKEFPVLQLKIQEYDDMTWDPMLLESQLHSMNENPLLRNDCHTSENKETEAKIYDNAVKEDLVSQNNIAFEMDDSLKELREELEVPIITANLERSENSFSLRIIKEKWNQAESFGEGALKLKSTQAVLPTIYPAENCVLADQESQPKEPSVLKYEINTDEFDTSPFDLRSLRDDNMVAFYAALHAETFTLSPSTLTDTTYDSKLAYPNMSEETKRAFEILKELLSKQFYQLLDPGSLSSMKTTLEYLCSTLSAEDDASLCLKSLALQLSTDFSQWSCDYIDASMKLKSSIAGLSKLDALEEGLIYNKNQFSEFSFIENELCDQLAYLEQRKKELEEHINTVKYNISISKVARETAIVNKRETFEKGRMLVAQRDQLRKHRPRLRSEQESAIATKANIEDEWSKIREKLDGVFNIFESKLL